MLKEKLIITGQGKLKISKKDGPYYSHPNQEVRLFKGAN